MMSVNNIPLDTMDYEELQDYSHKLDSEAEDIGHQIEMRTVEAKESGIPIDKRWLAKAKYAKKKKSLESNKVRMKMGEISKERRLVNQIRIEKFFIDVAKERLEEKTFRKILDEAERRLNE